MTDEELVPLLQAAVDAKLAYWDAIDALEVAMFGPDIEDDQVNAIYEDVALLAAGADDENRVTIEHVRNLKGLK